MELKSIINAGLLAGFVYGAYCGYQYLQLRDAITEELKGKPGIEKFVGDLDNIKINVSQYAPVECADGSQGSWWSLLLKQRSEGCFRLSLGLQGDTLKSVKMSTDYDTKKKIGERMSYVMLCKTPGEVTVKDNGMPREYQNCE